LKLGKEARAGKTNPYPASSFHDNDWIWMEQ